MEEKLRLATRFTARFGGYNVAIFDATVVRCLGGYNILLRQCINLAAKIMNLAARMN